MNYFGRLNFCRFLTLLVREHFPKECEQALNKQINLELMACHNYLNMAFHFNRCDVAAPGAFNFFKSASDEERQHAIKIMEYMNKRGGNIEIAEIACPEKKSFKSTKEAMMDALNMEKDVNRALLEAHSIASKNNDPNMCDFIETHFLQEQVDGIKILADFIRQIERSECEELGCYLFDKYLSHEAKGMHK